ncbi:hypothetical protein JCGZ_13631 [Jatropha curcas]|uniref:Uncharacterized protein n=1 Tax=Jatropha curcas TaxID=180498 RepID=A0A067KL96_JATCU|nr:hypothetical protein JCGZ_13631 [Jatropha curcas]
MASPSYRSGEDFLESLGISLDEVDLMADADNHASMTGVYAQIDPASGLAPLAWRWYKPNLHTVRCKKSLKELRAFFDTCPLEQAEVGPMTARLQSWIQADPDFQRSDALSRRRVVLSHPILRPPALQEVSLDNVDRPALPSEDITEVPIGLVNQMMELILGLQQEVATA